MTNKEKFDEMVKALDQQHAKKARPVTAKMIVDVAMEGDLIGTDELEEIFEWAETWKVPAKGLAAALDRAAQTVEKNRRQAEENENVSVVQTMNKTYSFVSHGGNNFVVRWQRSADFDRDEMIRMKPREFEVLENSKRVTIYTAMGPKDVGLGSFWLTHPQRETYPYGFDLNPKGSEPGYYNMWRGYSVEPAPGDWSLMQQHIFDVIASGVSEHYEYIMNWLAYAFQNPCTVPKVAIVLRGKKGTGKGIFASEVTGVWGSHGSQVTHAKHVTGNFNSHLAQTIMLFADEALFAGDKANGGVLKALISEETITIESRSQRRVSLRQRQEIQELLREVNRVSFDTVLAPLASRNWRGYQLACPDVRARVLGSLAPRFSFADFSGSANFLAHGV